MTSIDSLTPEEAFGKAVALYREQSGLSQKRLAEKLTDLGMKVDGPAVSRLEKGARAVRLSEAYKVAEALDVEIESLIESPSTAATSLRRARRILDQTWRSFRISSIELFENFENVETKLRDNPELLATLEDDEIEPPESVDGYLTWMLRRLKSVVSEWDPADADHKYKYFYALDKATRDRYLETLNAIAATCLVIGEEPTEQDEVSARGIRKRPGLGAGAGAPVPPSTEAKEPIDYFPWPVPPLLESLDTDGEHQAEV